MHRPNDPHRLPYHHHQPFTQQTKHKQPKKHHNQDLAYWSSWALTHWLALAASGALCAAAGRYPFAHSSPALMLAFYWLLAAALVSYAYAMSALFPTARVAGTAAQLVYAASMAPG